MADWIDVTVAIRQGMVHWPGNPGVEVRSSEDACEGGICRVSRLSLGVHTGTHVDAPNHFGVPGGGVESLPVDALVGPARVVGIPGKTVSAEDVERTAPEPGARLLFRTTNSERCWSRDDFVPDYVYVSLGAARALGERKVRAVGIDYLSIGGPADGPATHRVLLEAGICILEGLDLRRVPEGACDMMGLPLLIPGCDGAPARVLVRPRRVTA
jgi:arylformamidase